MAVFPSLGQTPWRDALKAYIDERIPVAHTHTPAEITNFTEFVQDAVAALLGGASGVTLSYDDTANTLTIVGPGASGLDAEAVRDAIGVAIVGTAPLSVAVNDGADTITFSIAPGTFAAAAHTHTTAQVTGLDAALAAKAPLSHQHPATDITGLTEAAQDAVAALLQGSSGVSLTYDDVNNTLTVAGSGVAGLDSEAVRDAIGVALIGTSPITIAVNDAADTITFSILPGSFAPFDHSHTPDEVIGFTEEVQDAVAAFLVEGAGVDITHNDAAGTLTVAATGSGGGSGRTRSQRIWAQQLASLKTAIGASLGLNEWHAPPPNVISASAPAEGQLLGQPIRIGANKVLTQMAVGVTTAGSATSKVRLGILSLHPGHAVDPNNLIDAGQIDASTTGWKVVNILLPVGIGQVILPVAVVQGVGGGAAPALRMQTAGPDAQQILGGPGADPTTQSAAGFGTWAYTHGQGALNDAYGGGSTLRSQLPSPRIFIRADANSVPSLVASPRPFARLPENVRLRGANLTIRYAHTQMWGTNWDWNWWKTQIDNAKLLGVNCIRVMGGQGAVTAGTPLATYLARWTQMADYIQAQGMYFYPALAGDDPVDGTGALIAGHQTTILQTAALLEAYPNVIAFDVYNEGGNSVPLKMAALQTLMAAVRAATSIPITMSQSANTEAQYRDERRSCMFTHLSDFMDLHVYTTALIDWPLFLRWQRSQWFGQRPTIYGEFGASMSLTAAERTGRYESMKALQANDPYAIGSFAWAMTDNGAAAVANENMGLFAHPTTFDGSERTEMTNVFKTFPVVE